MAHAPSGPPGDLGHGLEGDQLVAAGGESLGEGAVGAAGLERSLVPLPRQGRHRELVLAALVPAGLELPGVLGTAVDLLEVGDGQAQRHRRKTSKGRAKCASTPSVRTGPSAGSGPSGRSWERCAAMAAALRGALGPVEGERPGPGEGEAPVAGPGPVPGPDRVGDERCAVAGSGDGGGPPAGLVVGVAVAGEGGDAQAPARRDRTAARRRWPTATPPDRPRGRRAGGASAGGARRPGGRRRGRPPAVAEPPAGRAGWRHCPDETPHRRSRRRSRGRRPAGTSAIISPPQARTSSSGWGATTRAHPSEGRSRRGHVGRTSSAAVQQASGVPASTSMAGVGDPLFVVTRPPGRSGRNVLRARPGRSP